MWLINTLALCEIPRGMVCMTTRQPPFVWGMERRKRVYAWVWNGKRLEGEDGDGISASGMELHLFLVPFPPFVRGRIGYELSIRNSYTYPFLLFSISTFMSGLSSLRRSISFLLLVPFLSLLYLPSVLLLVINGRKGVERTLIVS